MPPGSGTSLQHIFGGIRGFVCENFACDSKLPLQKYIALPLFPFDMANFQDWGSDSPPYPHKFHPCPGYACTSSLGEGGFTDS